MLPIKKSFRWIYVLAGVFTINAAALLMSRVALGMAITVQIAISLAALSLIVSAIASVGYFGARIFSNVFILFDILGLGYMYYIILSDKNGGWADLTSAIGFVVFAGLGIIAGIITEIIYLIVRRYGAKR